VRSGLLVTKVDKNAPRVIKVWAWLFVDQITKPVFVRILLSARLTVGENLSKKRRPVKPRVGWTCHVKPQYSRRISCRWGRAVAFVDRLTNPLSWRSATLIATRHKNVLRVSRCSIVAEGRPCDGGVHRANGHREGPHSRSVEACCHALVACCSNKDRRFLRRRGLGQATKEPVENPRHPAIRTTHGAGLREW
jgi:hypothetical protein